MSKKLTEEEITTLKLLLNRFNSKLDNETFDDILLISKMKDRKRAFNLMNEEFIVISREDLEIV